LIELLDPPLGGDDAARKSVCSNRTICQDDNIS
jgi:hypothetical protein